MRPITISIVRMHWTLIWHMKRFSNCSVTRTLRYLYTILEHTRGKKTYLIIYLKLFPSKGQSFVFLQFYLKLIVLWFEQERQHIQHSKSLAPSDLRRYPSFVRKAFSWPNGLDDICSYRWRYPAVTPYQKRYRWERSICLRCAHAI